MYSYSQTVVIAIFRKTAFSRSTAGADTKIAEIVVVLLGVYRKTRSTIASASSANAQSVNGSRFEFGAKRTKIRKVP